MAVPTIINVIPGGGPSGGWTLLDIYGSNFRMPPDPPGQGVVPTPGPTVAVEFGEVPVLEVRVISPIRLMVLTAAHDPGDVDVVVRNLDDAGVPIPGEEVTLADGYAYARPDLTAESTITRVTRALIMALQQQVIENVVLTEHTEWDENPEDGLDVASIAKLPALILSGPDAPENKVYRTAVEAEIDGVASFIRTRTPFTVDLDFGIAGVSESSIQLLNMMEATKQFLMKTRNLTMLRDPSDPNGGTVSYELRVSGDFRVASLPNLSNVRNFTGRVAVRGVDIEGTAGVRGDFARGRGGQVGDDGATISTERFEAPTYQVGPSPGRGR